MHNLEPRDLENIGEGKKKKKEQHQHYLQLNCEFLWCILRIDTTSQEPNHENLRQPLLWPISTAQKLAQYSQYLNSALVCTAEQCTRGGSWIHGGSQTHGGSLWWRQPPGRGGRPQWQAWVGNPFSKKSVHCALSSLWREASCIKTLKKNFMS